MKRLGFIASMSVITGFIGTCMIQAALADDDAAQPTERRLPKPYKGELAVALPVFIATDRQALVGKDVPAGREFKKLWFTTADVTLPACAPWIEPGEAQSLSFSIRPATGLRIPEVIDWRGYVAEDKEMEQSVKIHSDEQIATARAASSPSGWSPDDIEKLKRWANKSGKRVYVYVHGFASTGINATYTAAILESALHAPVVLFTWPSIGTVGDKLGTAAHNDPKLPYSSKKVRPKSQQAAAIAAAEAAQQVTPQHLVIEHYKEDRQTVYNNPISADFGQTIEALRRSLPADIGISLVAHSLGNRIMFDYLTQRPETAAKISQICFVSPDVDARDFRNSADTIANCANEIMVFYNPHDKALIASRLWDGLHLLGMRKNLKLGRKMAPVENIEFIDYSTIAEPFYLRHYIPFQYLAPMIRDHSLASSLDKRFCLVRSSSIVKQHVTSSKEPTAPDR